MSHYVKEILNKQQEVANAPENPWNYLVDGKNVRKYVLLSAGCLVILSLAIPVLKELWQLWCSKEDFNGIYFIPILLGVIIYRRKEDFFHLYPRCFFAAFLAALVAVGFMMKAYGAHEIRIAGLWFIGSMGLYLWGMLGKEAGKILIGPFLFLSMVIPPNDDFMNSLTVLLQHGMSFMLDHLYGLFSNDYYFRDGFKLYFDRGVIVIAPECSGIRSLHGLLIGTLFFGLCDRLGVLKMSIMLLIALILPYIINLFRIIVTIELKHNGYKWLTEGIWHGLLGMAAFITGFLILSKLSKAFSGYSRKEKEFLRAKN